MNWIDAELALVALAAMVSPTTLTFSVLALVVSDRPLRSGLWFYAGALVATLGIGVVAAFVLGDAAATTDPSTPKTWVALIDVVAGCALLVWVVRALRRPRDPQRAAAMLEKMQAVSASRAVAIAGAGAVLANPGGFIPLALKSISELDPTAGEYLANWVFFALVSLLPLALALILLLVARNWTMRLLERLRVWLELHARTIAAVVLVALALALLRNGIAGLAA
ncbi:MAG: GAP family protein [Gaiellaceae bacterium]